MIAVETSKPQPFAPLAGIRVIEFSQMVMGPSCGLILADLGADVIKVEPLKGDRTRFFPGPAAGFFANYSRNKRSVAIDTASAAGQAVVRRLLEHSDVMIENFRPGLLARAGLDHESVAKFAPRLIYCSLKGYLPGPYENRLALDEVVQMMSGLAFMTGPPGQPLRAGASVNDIMGGMFGVIAIQAALAERQQTGRGRYIQSALFENAAFLMGQMMMYETVTGQKAIPYSVKQSSWSVYDLFDTKDGTKLFVSIVGEDQWAAFCQTFGKAAWLEDPRLKSNTQRVAARHWMLPEIAAIFKTWPIAELSAEMERLGLPFAPVNEPGALIDDPHLKQSGGLLDITLPDGRSAVTPALPMAIDGQRLPNRHNPPAIGADTASVLAEFGYKADEIAGLSARGVIGGAAV
jgi:crotonobetainyl-CoA:carnitine CoA-transferase CaiB-like acyl-CoA transferase